MHSLTQSLSHWSLFNMQLFFTWTWILLRLFIKKKKKDSQSVKITLPGFSSSLPRSPSGCLVWAHRGSPHTGANIGKQVYCQTRCRCAFNLPTQSQYVMAVYILQSGYLYLKKKTTTTCSVCAVFERGKKKRK